MLERLIDWIQGWFFRSHQLGMLSFICVCQAYFPTRRFCWTLGTNLSLLPLPYLLELFIVLYVLVSLVTGWYILAKSITPWSVKPLICSLRGADLVVPHSLWEGSGFSRVVFDTFPDHTLLLNSTNFWLIDLLFSTVPWGINCSTD